MIAELVVTLNDFGSKLRTKYQVVLELGTLSSKLLFPRYE